MRRKLFNFLSAASLVLMLATCLLWSRSYRLATSVTATRCTWPSADMCVSRIFSVRFARGHCMLLWDRSEYDVRQPDGIRFHHAMDVTTFRSTFAPGVKWQAFTYFVDSSAGYFLMIPMRYGFGVKYEPPHTDLGRTESSRYSIAPAWAVALFLAILPAIWVVRHRRKFGAGCCAQCGYDLRASPLRCPECGAVPTSSSMAPSRE